MRKSILAISLVVAASLCSVAMAVERDVGRTKTEMRFDLSSRADQAPPLYLVDGSGVAGKVFAPGLFTPAPASGGTPPAIPILQHPIPVFAPRRMLQSGRAADPPAPYLRS